VWAPAETDLTIRAQDAWFWRDDYYELGLHSVPSLVNSYENSVGHNTNMLLGLSPDPFGMIPSEDIKVYKLFGDAIRKCYGGAPINKTSGVGPTLVLHLGQTLVNRLVIQEDQPFGQHIRSYSLEFSPRSPKIKGTSIGNKKIEVLKDMMVSSVTLTITESTSSTPNITNFAAYYCPHMN